MERTQRRYFVYVLAGPGNNGGDGLVIARLLHKAGFDTIVVIPQLSDSFSPDFMINRERLEKIGFSKIILLGEEDRFPLCSGNTVIVDALFGTGLNRSVYGIAGKLIEKINAMDAVIISIDIPS